MKLLWLAVAFLAAIPALAVDTPRTLIVSFGNGTPADIVEKAIARCISMGGKVTHTYRYFPGFVMFALADAVDAMTAFGEEFAQYSMSIEENQIMSTLSKRKGEGVVEVWESK